MSPAFQQWILRVILQRVGRISRRRNPPSFLFNHCNGPHLDRSPFSKLAVRNNLARPIQGDNPRAGVAMKRRMRPIAHPGHQTMFHRIDITILDMATVVNTSRIRCSQNRRCQIPRSLRATRTELSRSCFGNALAKWLLMSHQRPRNQHRPAAESRPGVQVIGQR